MNEKLLGMPRHVAIAIGWLFFPFGIVLLAVEHAKMNYEEKLQVVTNFVLSGLVSIIAITDSILTAIFQLLEVYVIAIIISSIAGIALIALSALMIFCAVRCFMNKYYTVPVAVNIAKKFVKGAPVEEVKEEKAEEVSDPKAIYKKRSKRINISRIFFIIFLYVAIGGTFIYMIIEEIIDDDTFYLPILLAGVAVVMHFGINVFFDLFENVNTIAKNSEKE